MPSNVKMNLNQHGSDKYTILHAACEVGNEEIVSYILYKLKLDPNIKSLDGNEYVPLELACLNGQPRIVNILLKSKRT